MAKRPLLVLVPALVFVLLLGLLVFGLSNNPRTIPSVLINTPLPPVHLAGLKDGKMIDLRQRMRGQVWLLNVWASWCTACRLEHPLLVELNNQQVQLVGLNYKDASTDAIAWLQEVGDPYMFSLSDIEGRAGINLGVYGVPETFVIDSLGIIRYKHIGPLTSQVLASAIVPMLNKLRS